MRTDVFQAAAVCCRGNAFLAGEDRDRAPELVGATDLFRNVNEVSFTRTSGLAVNNGCLAVGTKSWFLKMRKEGVEHFRIPDTIAITLRLGVEARMERRGDHFHGSNANLDWQLRVQRAHDDIGFDVARQRDARDLRKRVDAGVRPAGPCDRDVPSFEIDQGVFDQALNRRALGLPLPADEPRPVVGKREFEGAHSSCGS